MSQESTCIFCKGVATREDIPGPTQDAYRVKCSSCGTYDFSDAVEEDYKGKDEEYKQAVSDYIKECDEKNEIPELHKLFGTDEINWHIENNKKKRSG